MALSLNSIILTTNIRFTLTANNTVIVSDDFYNIGISQGVIIVPSDYYDKSSTDPALATSLIEIYSSGNLICRFDWRNVVTPSSVSRTDLINSLITNFFFKLGAGGSGGSVDLSGYVTKLTTVNGHYLSSNVTITANDLKYTKVFYTTDWIGSEAPYTITVTNVIHGLGETNSLLCDVREFITDHYRWAIVDLDYYANGDVIISSNVKFQGKLIIM